MPEIIDSSFEWSEVPGYGLLDVVKIDGRWAQIMTGIMPSRQLVRYLDDDSDAGFCLIDMSNYVYAPFVDIPNVIKYFVDKKIISEAELRNIRWDSDNIGTYLALQVRVFGKLKRKNF